MCKHLFCREQDRTHRRDRLETQLEKGIWCCDNLSLNGRDLVSVKWAGVDTSWSLPKVWVLARRL